MCLPSGQQLCGNTDAIIMSVFFFSVHIKQYIHQFRIDSSILV